MYNTIRIIFRIKIIILAWILFKNNDLEATSIVRITEEKNTYELLENKFERTNYSFKLKNNSSVSDFYIVAIQPFLDSVSIQYGEQKQLIGFKAGVPTVNSYNYVTPITIPPNTEVLVHINGRKFTLNLKYKILLIKENQFIKTTNTDNLFFGMFLGLYLMYILLIVAIYIISRNNLFKQYLYISIVLLLNYLFFSGFGYAYVWYHNQLLQIILPISLFLIYILLHISFFISFFNFKVQYPKIYLFIMIYRYVLVIFSVVLLANELHVFPINLQLYTWTFLLYSIYFVYILITVYVSVYTYLKTKRIEAIWVLIGLLLQSVFWIILFNTIYFTYDGFNWIHYFKFYNSYLFVLHTNILLTIIEFAVIGFFIAYNYRSIIKQSNISIKRLKQLQEINYFKYIKSTEATQTYIKKYIDTNILIKLLAIKEDFYKYINMAPESKIHSSIIENITQTEHDLNSIITSNDSNESLHTFLQITQYITQNLPDSIQPIIEIEDELLTVTILEEFSKQFQRILQELINNTLKHTQATIIRIELKTENKHLYFYYSDNGILAKEHKFRKGLGMINIESRVHDLNGILTITEESSLNYQIVIPLNKIVNT